MAGDMAASALRDLLATTKDGDWGKDSPADGLVPYRVIRGTDFPSVRLGDTSSVPIRYLSDSTVHRRTLSVDDILLETAGGSPDRPTGRSLLINQRLLASLDLPATCASFARFLRVDPDKAEPRFVYWFLQYLYASGQMEEHQVQHTGVARFQYTKFAESQEIPLPPRDAQRAIAYILGRLDDKIELNRRMNETLEAMARALFKSWFMDFDPVRAKAEGRDPGLPKPLADLFPARLVDSELGEIPEGWHVERLSDVMTFQGGAQPPASQFISEERESYVRLVQIRDFYSSDHITFVPDSPKLRKFETDDIMIARYGSSGNAEKSNDSLARICRGLSGAYNVALVKVVPKRPCREFLGQFLRSAPFQSVSKGMGARSVQSGFRKEDLDIIDVVVAPAPVHVAFERFATAVWERTKATGDQSRKLAALRDALLPKLISGELRVNRAERLVVEGL